LRRRRSSQRWPQLNSEYTVYICSYKDYSSVVPRHHISGVSVCREIGALKDIGAVLSKEQLEVLESRGELIVADVEVLERMLKNLGTNFHALREEIGEQYIYALIRPKKPRV